jgi:hypothetical protein
MEGYLYIAKRHVFKTKSYSWQWEIHLPECVVIKGMTYHKTDKAIAELAGRRWADLLKIKLLEDVK